MLDIPNLSGSTEPRTVAPRRRATTPGVAVARIQVLSDLNLDAGPNAMPSPTSDVDAVVVAGDTAAGASTAFAFLRAAFPRPIPLVVVLGNREFHGRPIGRERSAARSLAKLHDIVLLDDGVAYVAGVRFVGSTLWTDYTLDGAKAQPEMMFAAASSIEDHAKISLLPEPWIRFRPYDALAQHHASRRFLSRELGVQNGRTTVVVTHHAPSRRSLVDGTGFTALDGCHASDMEDIVARSGAALWIHGHDSVRCDYVLGRTRVLSNPRGRRASCADFDPGLVVEVPILRQGVSGLDGFETLQSGAAPW